MSTTILLRALGGRFNHTPIEPPPPPKYASGDLGWVDDGRYAGSRQKVGGAYVFPSPFGASSLRLPPTWAITDAGMRQCVLNVGLHELINVTSSGTEYKAGSLEAMLKPLTDWNAARPETLRVKIRLHVGDRAPNYWHTATGGEVKVADSSFKKIGFVPRHWTTTYRELYADAMAVLAPVVDAMPYVNSINAPGAAFFYPEPFLRFPTATVNESGTQTTGKNLVAAGYTQAADRAFNEWFPSAHSVFEYTVVEVALNPAGFVSTTGGSTAVDQTHLQTVGNNLIAAMPAGHAQLANYSAREDYMTGTGSYQTMYNYMASKASTAWVGVQLARPHQVAQTSPDTDEKWDDVATWAANKGFHFVETTGPKSGTGYANAPDGGTANVWPTAYTDDAPKMLTIGANLLDNTRPTVA